MVELSNVHDEGITFEPIHRVVFNIDTKDIFESMKNFYNNSEVTFEKLDSLDMVNKKLKNLPKTPQSTPLGLSHLKGMV